MRLVKSPFDLKEREESENGFVSSLRLLMALRTDVSVAAKRIPPRKPVKREPGATDLGVVAPPPIQIESVPFTGSLATLFTLAREGKIDLREIRLLPICESYFQYLATVSLPDLDRAASALAALAYLIERKAWALLPTAEPAPVAEEDHQVIHPTIHEYEVAMEALATCYQAREQLYFRPQGASSEPYEVPLDLGNISADHLAMALKALLERASPAPIEPLGRPRRSLSDQMQVVYRALCRDWRGLDEVITLPFTREEAVYWFLALLELIRLGQARVRLEGTDVQFARAA